MVPYLPYRVLKYGPSGFIGYIRGIRVPQLSIKGPIARDHATAINEVSPDRAMPLKCCISPICVQNQVPGWVSDICPTLRTQTLVC